MCADAHDEVWCLAVAIKQQACSGVASFVDARGEQAQWPPQTKIMSLEIITNINLFPSNSSNNVNFAERRK